MAYCPFLSGHQLPRTWRSSAISPSSFVPFLVILRRFPPRLGPWAYYSKWAGVPRSFGPTTSFRCCTRVKHKARLYIYIYIFFFFFFFFCLCKTQLITSSAELFFSFFEEVNYLKSPNVVVSAKEVTSEQQFRKNCQTAATDLALLHARQLTNRKL